MATVAASGVLAPSPTAVQSWRDAGDVLDALDPRAGFPPVAEYWTARRATERQPLGDRRWIVEVSPGAVKCLSRSAVPLALEWVDELEQLEEKAAEARRVVAARVALAFGQEPDDGWPVDLFGDVAMIEIPLLGLLGSICVESSGSQRGAIEGWSPASRRRMMYRLATLDWEALPGVAEMVTLTYPGVFPKDGRTVKAHLRAFAERWFRRWGSRPVGVWKLEFQRRGAPHFHLYLGRPAVAARDFREWVSRAWYEVVGSGDDRHLRAGTGVDHQFMARTAGVKALAIYFSKHNAKWGESKGYQNDRPEWFQNVGRFWGVWGLAPATVQVELTRKDWFDIRRMLADVRVARSHLVRPAVRRVDRSTGEISARRVTRRLKVRRSGLGGLYALVDNGPRLSVQIARWLRSATEPPARLRASRLP